MVEVSRSLFAPPRLAAASRASRIAAHALPYVRSDMQAYEYADDQAVDSRSCLDDRYSTWHERNRLFRDAQTPRPPHFNRAFYADVVRALKLQQLRESCRYDLYGTLAADSRVSHTPHEIRLQHNEPAQRFARMLLYYKIVLSWPSSANSSGASTPRNAPSTQTTTPDAAAVAGVKRKQAPSPSQDTGHTQPEHGPKVPRTTL
jgi:hypothetical protein